MDEEQKRLAEELLFDNLKKTSFAKQLFFGTFERSILEVARKQDPAQEEKAAQLLKELAQFAKEKINPDEIDRTGTIPDAIIKFLSTSGTLGMTVPKEYGGLGLSQRTFCHAVEILAGRCASTALFTNVHLSIGLRALLIFGTKEQKAKWLPPLARGEKFAAFSLTEANAGSDASAVETRATYDPIKNVYRLNGKKQWTTNGSIADVLTVMARTEVTTAKGKEEKITAFLVTPDMPGFSILNPALEKVGYRGTKTANLAFNDMEVPAENILGPLGGGLRVCLTVLDYGRTAFGATCTGAAKFCQSKALEHAKTRHQFKRPLASFSLVKEKLVRISALAYAMDATTELTASLVDKGEEDFMLEAAILKVFASDSLWEILYETMQIYGGRSFFTDHPFERMMRDARLNMIGEGANEVMRAFIGVVGMRDVGLELKEILDKLKSFPSSSTALLAYIKTLFKRWKNSQVSISSKELQDEARKLSRAIRKFGIAVVRSLAKYREEIVEEQLLLNRIATSAIAIYTATAVLRKLNDELVKNKSTSSNITKDLVVGKFYIEQAMKRVDNSLSHLFDPQDQLILDISRSLC